MRKCSKFKSIFTTLLFALVIANCGGGSNSENPADPANPGEQTGNSGGSTGGSGGSSGGGSGSGSGGSSTPAFSFASIDQGFNHGCGLKDDGSVWCWGYNSFGQLGNNSDVDSSLPVQVDDSNMGAVVAIALGSYHSCALKSDGSAWCWGDNGEGQLGHNSTDSDSPTPVQVDDSSMGAVVALSLGYGHSCALKSDGTAWCWGDNYDGQLGHNSTDSESRTPVQVDDSNMGAVAALSLGDYHSCALKSDGSAWCWGDNGDGQLGHNSTDSDSPTPVQVDDSSMGAVVAIALGSYHSCALKSDGSAWCWGYNDDGQLGHNSTDSESLTPVQVDDSNMDAVASLSLGGYHSCALKTDGSAWCWGENDDGQLGHNSTDSESRTPVQVDDSNMDAVASLSLGGYHSCALKSDGSVWCWGDNEDGQLSLNDFTADSLTQVDDIVNPLSLQIYANTTYALDAEGALWSWGTTSFLSYTSSEINGPEASTNWTQITNFSVHYDTLCAVKTDQSVWCAGTNASGELGDNSSVFYSYAPVQVDNQNLGAVSTVHVGSNHACALETDGDVWCWGDNLYGQLGDNNTPNDSGVPVQTTVISGVGQMDSGLYFSCALIASSQKVYCWGRNNQGQAGINTSNASSPRPRDIGLSGVDSIALGDQHGCALTTNGGVWCWGDNSDGQLGNGTTSSTGSYQPQQVNGLTATAIFADGDSTCALDQSGQLWCWGSNNIRFGIADQGVDLTSPTLTGFSNVSSLSWGNSHSCFIDTQNTASCYGEDGRGQLGSGRLVKSLVPVESVLE